MGYRLKKRGKSSGEEVSLSEQIYWLASTFNWTMKEIYKVTLLEFNFLMDGACRHNEKQDKAMKKSQGAKPGKWEADDLSQLQGLPGVRKVNNRKRKI